jgi:hypothetical protein
MGFIRLSTGEVSQGSWCENGVRMHYKNDNVDLIPKQERWRAEKGEQFYVVDDVGCVNRWVVGAFGIDEQYYNSGNYFQTEEQAKASKFYKVFHD